MLNKKRALFIGRFQPFHKGHFQVVKKLLSRYNEIIIMIGSAETELSLDNPFTAAERIEMIRSCFSKGELSRIIIIPVRDIYDHSVWVKHLLSYIPKFDTVYSNNELVNSLFCNKGIEAKKIDFIKRQQYEGKKIRKLMLSGNEWKNFVPKQIILFISSVKFCERLKKTKATD